MYYSIDFHLQDVFNNQETKYIRHEVERICRSTVLESLADDSLHYSPDKRLYGNNMLLQDPCAAQPGRKSPYLQSIIFCA